MITIQGVHASQQSVPHLGASTWQCSASRTNWQEQRRVRMPMIVHKSEPSGEINFSYMHELFAAHNLPSLHLGTAGAVQSTKP